MKIASVIASEYFYIRIQSRGLKTLKTKYCYFISLISQSIIVGAQAMVRGKICCCVRVKTPQILTKIIMESKQ